MRLPWCVVPRLERAADNQGKRVALKPSQERHLNRIMRQFIDLLIPKFTKGAEEHKTLLHEMNPEWLIDAAIEEAIDQVVYLITLKERLGVSNKH